MLFGDHPVVIRGGGDLGTGVAYRLERAGFPVTILELDQPLTIRRAVAFSTAVTSGRVEIEGIEGRRVESPSEAHGLASTGVVAVLVSPHLPAFSPPPAVLVDARLAKRNLDTALDQAPLVVALGPGFVAGVDCDAVIETQRGHRLGRVYWEGSAAADTGEPGSVGGKTTQRVVRSPDRGDVHWTVAIGDHVSEGELLGRVGDAPLVAPLTGVVRGLIGNGHPAVSGLKVADIDPRGEPAACFEISDKALAVGGGVLEAILTWLDRKGN